MKHTATPSLLSVVVPAYNEAGSIDRVLTALSRADLVGMRLEIIVVDDGSIDDTAVVAAAALSNLGLDGSSRVIRLDRNGGKSAALKRGFAETQGDLVIVQDADMEYDPDDIASLLRPVIKDRADAVVGSRFMGGHPRRVVYLSNAIGNRVMSTLFSITSGLRLTDIHCCYILLPGDLARASIDHITSSRWGFNPEICALLADWRHELRIVEVGISYYGRSKAEGKKIRMRHGVVAVLEILKFNFRRPRPFP
jgi:glycosyltransferase involved in cell wall biosynthesis